MTDRRLSEEFGGDSNGTKPHENYVPLGSAEGIAIDCGQLTGD
jgi:hypothetical protein